MARFVRGDGTGAAEIVSGQGSWTGTGKISLEADLGHAGPISSLVVRNAGAALVEVLGSTDDPADTGNKAWQVLVPVKQLRTVKQVKSGKNGDAVCDLSAQLDHKVARQRITSVRVITSTPWADRGTGLAACSLFAPVSSNDNASSPPLSPPSVSAATQLHRVPSVVPAVPMSLSQAALDSDADDDELEGVAASEDRVSARIVSTSVSAMRRASSISSMPARDTPGAPAASIASSSPPFRSSIVSVTAPADPAVAAGTKRRIIPAWMSATSAAVDKPTAAGDATRVAKSVRAAAQPNAERKRVRVARSDDDDDDHRPAKKSARAADKLKSDRKRARAGGDDDDDDDDGVGDERKSRSIKRARTTTAAAPPRTTSTTTSSSTSTQPRDLSAAIPADQLLRGVGLVLSGFVNPQRAQLRNMALEMGARYHPDWCRQATHLVCAVAGTPKYNQVVRAGGIIVDAQWLRDCHAVKARLPEADYALDAAGHGRGGSQSGGGGGRRGRGRRRRDTDSDSDSDNDESDTLHDDDADADDDDDSDSDSDDPDGDWNRASADDGSGAEQPPRRRGDAAPAQRRETRQRKRGSEDESSGPDEYDIRDSFINDDDADVSDRDDDEDLARVVREGKAFLRRGSSRGGRRAAVATDEAETEEDLDATTTNNPRTIDNIDAEDAETEQDLDAETEEDMDAVWNKAPLATATTSSTTTGVIDRAGDDADNDDDATEEDVPGSTAPLLTRAATGLDDLPALPDYLDGVHVYVFDCAAERRVTRFVVAFGGSVDQYLGDETQYVVTDADWTNAFTKAVRENPKLRIVRASWIDECVAKHRCADWTPHAVPHGR